VSSNPPDYGVGVAVPYGAAGSFEETLTLRAVIDADHDCRVVACALVTRHDDTNRDDRTQDLYLPVAFASASEDEPEQDDAEPASVEVDDEDDGGGSGAGLAIAGGAGVAVLGALGLAWRRRAAGRAP
jgi:hypothetical protein